MIDLAVDIVGDGDAAGVGMLDDHAGRRLKLPDALKSRIAVSNVVVGKRLALQLLGRGQRTGRGPLIHVERRILVRVLAIAHLLNEFARVKNAVAERIVTKRLCEIGGYGRVVSGRVRKGLGGKPPPDFDGQLVGLQQADNRFVIVGVDHDSNTIMVLGCGPNHRGAADVDVLDSITERRVVPRDRFLEGIEVNGEEVDGFDTVFVHDRLVGTTSAKQSTVYDRVQGLDAAIHDFGKTGFFGNLDNLDTGFAN